MSMVDLMWLFCGAFIGGLITLFFMAMVNASHEAEALEQAQRKIQALEEDKRALRIALESPTSPEKEKPFIDDGEMVEFEGSFYVKKPS